jgi:hypothetical protein
MKWILLLVLAGCGDKVCKHWVDLQDKCVPDGNSEWIPEACSDADRDISSFHDKIIPEAHAALQRAKKCVAEAKDCGDYKRCIAIMDAGK